MKWQLRSYLLRTLSRSPAGLRIYQMLQGGFGLHRSPEFLLGQLRWQAHLARDLSELGCRLEGARVVEIGTGWVPLAPIGFWLCGAQSVDTFDVHRWMLRETTRRALRLISSKREELTALYAPFAHRADLERRLSLIASLDCDPDAVLAEAGIKYRAPADARQTGLERDSVDIAFSMQVFEHVPQEQISKILDEMRRVLRPSGWSAHQIDPSDHFAHFDSSITSIHFLGFEDEVWARVAGNALAYHNRLRFDDHMKAFTDSGFVSRRVTSRVDERALNSLRDGFKVAARFEGKPPEELCRHSIHIYSQKLVNDTGARPLAEPHH